MTPARRWSARWRAAIAHAAGHICRAPGSCTSSALAVAALLAVAWPAPASAQVGASASIYSDYRFRGYSLSERRPVGIVDFAYDDPSGLYANASASAVLRRSGNPAPLGLQVSGGYAKRLASGTTLDFGVTHSTYAHYSHGERGQSYTEFYAGIARGGLSSRIFVSPHYFERGRWTAYGEVNGSLSPARKWSVDGHVGILVTGLRPTSERYSADFDWSVGVTRELGRLSLHAAWSDGAPGHDHYGGRAHSRDAVVVGASWVL